MKTYVTFFLVAVACVALYAVIWPREAATEAERKAIAEGRTVIIYWDRHSGHEHEARRALIDEFNRSQSKVYVRALPIGFNASMEKLLTSVAGGTPPDICALETATLAELVAQGCFMPIEDLLGRSAGIRMDDFLPYCRDQVCWDGHVWGIPTTTDTMCLLWNKNAFRKAGIDPERPPQTFSELTDYATKLTVQDGSGIQQLGFLPWQPWDLTAMWGLLYGGKWYDVATGQMVCAKDPNLLRMMQWQLTFSKDPGSKNNPPYAMDPEKISSFQKGAGAYMSANNPFYTGKVAMIAEGEWQVTFIPKYAPELEWGVAPLPMPDGMPPLAYGGAVVADCIPRGCKHPDEAWQFMNWFYSPRPNGGTSPASDYNFAIHNIPPRGAEARQSRFIDDPKFRVFVDALTTRPVVTLPVMPAAQFLADEMDRQREFVVFRKSTPAQALADIEEKTNAELADVRKLMKGSGS